jgi:hypothetical protein
MVPLLPVACLVPMSGRGRGKSRKGTCSGLRASGAADTLMRTGCRDMTTGGLRKLCGVCFQFPKGNLAQVSLQLQGSLLLRVDWLTDCSSC